MLVSYKCYIIFTLCCIIIYSLTIVKFDKIMRIVNNIKSVSRPIMLYYNLFYFKF